MVGGEVKMIQWFRVETKDRFGDKQWWYYRKDKKGFTAKYFVNYLNCSFDEFPNWKYMLWKYATDKLDYSFNATGVNITTGESFTQENVDVFDTLEEAEKYIVSHERVPILFEYNKPNSKLLYVNKKYQKLEKNFVKAE
jgi:hypothetical protein